MRVGAFVVGVRVDSDATGEFLADVLRDHLVAGVDASPNYSVRLTPAETDSPARELHRLYRSSDLVVRSRTTSRIAHGLLAHLSAQMELQEGGPIRVATFALVKDDRVVLANRRFRHVIEKLESRLNARGIRVADAPAVELLEAVVTIPRPRFELDDRARAILAAWDITARADRELGAAPPGQYQLGGWLFETRDGVDITRTSPLVELLAAVTNLDSLDAKRTLDALAVAAGRVPVSYARWSETREIIDLVAELLGRR